MKRFELVIGDEDAFDEEGKPKRKGWRQIAITDKPAITTTGVAFESETRYVIFEDQPKMRIAAPVMIPKEIDKAPVKGFNDDKPFTVVTTREGLEEQLKDLMSNPDNLKCLFNVKHDPSIEVPAYLLEIWIVEDPTTDKSYKTFGVKCVPGTIFAVIQFTDEEFYNKAVQEGWTGFSIEGLMDYREVKFENEVIDYADTILIQDGKTILFKRNESDEFEPGKWGLAGGKVEYGDGTNAGEDVGDAAKRELFEETGITATDLQPIGIVNYEDGKKSMVYCLEIPSDQQITLSDEHTEIKAVSVADIANMDVAMKQNELYEHLVNEAFEVLKLDKMDVSTLQEGQEFQVGDTTYVITDGKPVIKGAEVEETMEDNKEEKKDPPADPPAKEAEVKMEAMTPEMTTAVQALIDASLKTAKEEFAKMLEESETQIIEQAVGAKKDGDAETKKEEVKFETEDKNKKVNDYSKAFDFLSK